MKIASFSATLLLGLVAIAHVLRLVLRVPITVGAVTIPFWASVLGFLVPGAIAALLWRGSRVRARYEDDPFEHEVERLKTELDEAVARLKSGGHDQEWLRTLYGVRAESMRADNERIWNTGAIFVPLSLSAFVALFAVEAPSWWKTAVLAAGSTSLLILWLFIAENHRSFQQGSEAWMVAILRILGIQNGGTGKVKGNALNRWLTGPGAIQKARWTLAVLVAAGWMTILCLQWSGRILVDRPDCEEKAPASQTR